MEPPAASMKPVIEPNFIAIEGAIGAGKTSLVNLLGKQLDAKLVLENDDENPFLPDFYRDKESFAHNRVRTRLKYLLSSQQRARHWRNPTEPGRPGATRNTGAQCCRRILLRIKRRPLEHRGPTYGRGARATSTPDNRPICRRVRRSTPGPFS